MIVRYIGMRASNPLLVASSGGGGHIAAIKGIIDSQYSSLNLVRHDPKVYQRNQFYEQSFIYMAMNLLHIPYVGRPIRSILRRSRMPVLPARRDVEAEIQTITSNQRIRNYIDMLLDVYPAGYEATAMYNCLQKQEQTETIRGMVK